jgi:hypothetical protein
MALQLLDGLIDSWAVYPRFPMSLVLNPRLVIQVASVNPRVGFSIGEVKNRLLTSVRCLCYKPF